MAEKPVESDKDFNHILRIANTEIKGNKKIIVALQNIKGVGFSFSNMICKLGKFDKRKKAGYLKQEEIKKIETLLENPSKAGVPAWMFNRRLDPEEGVDTHLIGTELFLAKDSDVKNMKKTKSYKGLRHQWGLPVRGQRTRSNFRKNKGKVKGVTRKAQAAKRK